MTASAPSGDPAGQRTEWLKLVVFPVVVALLIVALTPLGDNVRELLFPTKAAVSGNVTMGGRPVEGAVVALDGEDVGQTEPGGTYLLTEVGKGSHLVKVRAIGAHPGQVSVAVPRGASEVKATALNLRPLVELGYAITSLDLRSSGQQSSTGGFVLKYDFTLWVNGDEATLGQVTAVSYALPAPLTSAPVSATSRPAQFCYRQSGSFSFDRLLGSPGLGNVSATVTLDNGQSFPVTGQAGDRPPPPCKAKKASTKELPPGQSPTIPPPGHGSPPPPPPATSPPAPSPSPIASPTTSPSPPTPPASGPRILSFTADSPDCGAGSGVMAAVTLRYDVRDADTFSVDTDGNEAAHGALAKAPTSLQMGFPCDGKPHAYQLTVFDSDGHRSEPRSVTVKAGSGP